MDVVVVSESRSRAVMIVIGFINDIYHNSGMEAK